MGGTGDAGGGVLRGEVCTTQRSVCNHPRVRRAFGPSRVERQRAIDILDVQEGRGPVDLASDVQVAELFRTARRIAVVGASPNPDRPSNGVLRYLLREAYECVPVNPNAPSVLGLASFPDLEAAVASGGPFDIIDVFRRSEFAPDVARSAVATGARCLWLQLGVVSWEAAEIAHAGGLLVVMDRCTAIEHRRLRDR